MKIIFFGTPEFAVPPLKKLIASEYDISAVVTQPDKKSGRGKHMNACPVKNAAIEAGLSVLQPRTVKDGDFIDQLKNLAPDIIVTAAYGQILPPGILGLPEYGCINIHASLLPKYRGAAPVNWAIINGEKKTGITTMLMDEGMDTGPVLMQKEIDIGSDETTAELLVRLSHGGAELLMVTLKDLTDKKLVSVKQSGGETYAPLLKKTDGLIDWTMPADNLSNFIRGMNPWPGAYSFINNVRFKILKGAVVDYIKENDSPENAGMIIKAAKDELYVSAGSGTIAILEIQPAGKPAMSVSSFLQGRRVAEGMMFGDGQ